MKDSILICNHGYRTLDLFIKWVSLLEKQWTKECEKQACFIKHDGVAVGGIACQIGSEIEWVTR